MNGDTSGRPAPAEYTGSPPAAADRMRRALAEIASRHGRAADLAGRYRAMCVAGAEVLEVDGASLTLIGADGASTLLASSDRISERVAELDFTTGDGPTREAFASGLPVLEPELDGSRWPMFGPTAAELDVRAVFAFPLQMGAIRFGVLCLNRNVPGALTGPQMSAAAVLLRAGLAAILADLGEAPSPEHWLGEVDGYLNVVHQATGMVLVQLGVNAQDALLRLRSYAFRTGRSLGDVAADVVERRLSFQEDQEDPA